MQYVEYIQNGTNISGGRSTGWMINFNRYPTNGTMVEIKFNHQNSTTDGNSFFGCHHYDGTDNYFRLFSYQTGKYFLDSPTDGNSRISVNVTFGQDVILQATAAPNVSLTNVNTQQTATATNSRTPLWKYPMALWYGYDGDNGNVVEGTRVYYIKIYENNTLVMDLWPAVDNSIAGFFDKIGRSFYHNNDTTKQYVVGPSLSSINATPSKTVLAATGETINIVVDCENAWEVSGNTFLTLSSTGDTSGTTITATAPSYMGASARIDTLTFTDSVTGDEAEITIRQKYPTNGQPMYLGSAEISEIYLGADTITEAYLGDVLVFSAVAPAPTGGTRVISISSIPIPVLDGEGNAGQTNINIDDEDQNYASLSLTYNDPWDSSSYEENVDATQSFSASYVSGYFEIEGEWGDDITITYTYTDGVCASVPSGYDTEQPTFENGVISVNFPTPESDAECECTNAGGTWDGVECTYPEPDPCEGMGEEECECVSNGGTWVVPEIGDPYCIQAVYGIRDSSAPNWDLGKYIDTGIYVTNQTGMTVRIKYIGAGQFSDRIVGFDANECGSDNEDFRFFPHMTDAGSERLEPVPTSLYDTDVEQDITFGNTTELFIYDNKNQSMVMSGATGGTINQSTTIRIDMSTNWMKQVTIYDDGVAVWDGVAAEDNGVYGFLDNVSGNFYTNSNLTIVSNQVSNEA